MKVAPKKVLITGAAGWLGKSLLESLITGKNCNSECYKPNQIRILCRNKSEIINVKEYITDGVDYIQGDLTNNSVQEEFLLNAENSTLYNLAGIIHPNLFSQKDFNLINNIAVTSLAKKSVEAGVSKFIAVSSNSPNGYSKNHLRIFDEKALYKPYMGYGKSKMFMEKGIKLLASNQSNTNFTIIRAPWFYGPNQPLRQTTFFTMVKNGVFPIMGKGLNIRSMVYIDNLVDGLIKASNYFEKNGEVFWIADKEPYQMIEIVSTVKNLLKNEFNIKVSNKQIYMPSIVSDMARYADFISQSIGIYLQKVHVLSEMNQTIACSIDKAEKILNYNPKTSLEEGMKESIKWCINSGIDI